MALGVLCRLGGGQYEEQPAKSCLYLMPTAGMTRPGMECIPSLERRLVYFSVGWMFLESAHISSRVTYIDELIIFSHMLRNQVL
jgi:hypothetical protein